MTQSSFRTLNEQARPAGIEEPLNRAFVHPLAASLLPLAARLRIPPNAISLSGIGFGVLAAIFYQDWRDWRFATLGFAAMLGWHVTDGLDGMVARATNRVSAFGRFLDGICDYSVFFLIYVSLVLVSREQIGAALTWSLTALAGVAHALQAAHYEACRDAYVRRRAGVFGEPARRLAGGLVERFYNAGQSLVGQQSRRLDARLAAEPGLHEAYLQRLQPVLRRYALLAPTGRTLAIWIACLAGAPAFYWGWELVVLTPLTFALNRHRRRVEAAL